jgi:hypothetical protein
MAVDFRGWAVGGPACMGDGYLLEERLRLVDFGVGDELFQSSDLSDMLEEDYRARGIAVDADACEMCERCWML